MKLVFLVIIILINFFNHRLIKAEEKIDKVKNKIENIAKKESINDYNTKERRVHIVKIGDTISSISKFYSINKDLIIKLNKLKDENYIYVGQNLFIAESTKDISKQSVLLDNYHIVQIGENLTDISNKHNLNISLSKDSIISNLNKKTINSNDFLTYKIYDKNFNSKFLKRIINK